MSTAFTNQGVLIPFIGGSTIDAPVAIENPDSRFYGDYLTGALAMNDSGNGTITGVTQIMGVAKQCKVSLLREDFTMIDFKLSNSDGTFTFENLNVNNTYIVRVRDLKNTYDYVIKQNRVTV